MWCIAVNPPDDDSFPLLITSNVNPRELLFPENAESPIALTCPRKWGGTCFKFCEKSAVIVRSGGSIPVDGVVLEGSSAVNAMHKGLFNESGFLYNV